MDNIDYGSLYGSLDCLGDTVDVDLSQYENDGGSVLDEIPENSRFVKLSDFLERGDDEYEKWGLE